MRLASPARAVVALGAAALCLAAPSAAHAQPSCKGNKELFQGRCLYPEEIRQLKQQQEAQRRAALDKQRQEEEARQKEAQEQARRQAEQQQRAKADTDACARAREADTVEAWNVYLAAHPEGTCLAEGKARVARLDREPEAPAPLPPPEEGGVSPLVWVGFGVGGAGLVTFAVAGGIALSRKSALDDACGGGDLCPSSQRDAHDDALVAAHVATVGAVVAGAGAALGVVGLLLSGGGEAEVSAVLGPTTLGLRGRF